MDLKERAWALWYGTIRVRIVGSEPETFLQQLREQRIELFHIVRSDSITIVCTLRASAEEQLCALAAKHGCEIKVVSRWGGLHALQRIHGHRWILLALLLGISLALLSSLYIWSIEIEGCENISRAELLRELSREGIAVGRYWPGIDAEELRTDMLLKFDCISWMSVQVHGSKATIRLKDRLFEPEIFREEDAVDLAARRGGVIRSCSVQTGQCIVEEGQTVSRGEVLVSHTVESSFAPIRTVHARGRIIADTYPELSSAYPMSYKAKQQLKKSVRLAMIFGKNRINFYFGGRKTDGKCDKISQTYQLGIRGLFSLPIRIVRETITAYTAGEEKSFSAELSAEHLEAELAGETQGEILSSGISFSSYENYMIATLRAHCRENIAVENPAIP